MATEFVQIGDIGFNSAQIVTVDFGDSAAGDDQVWVDFVAGGQENTDNHLLLGGPSARAFKQWWERVARRVV